MSKLYEEQINKLKSIFGDHYEVEQDKNILNNSFVKYDVIYLNEIEGVMKKIDQLLICNVHEFNHDWNQYFQLLNEYESNHRKKYKDTTTYKTRVAFNIEILLPKKIKTLEKKRRIVKCFLAGLNYEKRKMYYIVYEIQRNNAVYLNILIGGREYIKSPIRKLHKQNRFKKDGTMTIKCGDPVKDKNGNLVMISETFADDKIRYFSYKSFISFIKQLREYFLAAIKRIVKKKTEKVGFKKVWIMKKYHFYNRKWLGMLNNVKRYMETMINYGLSLMEEQTDYEMYYWKRPIRPEGYGQLMSLYNKNRVRFEKESFHDNDGTEHSFKWMRGNNQIPELEQHLEVLIEEFNDELNLIVPGILEL